MKTASKAATIAAFIGGAFFSPLAGASPVDDEHGDQPAATRGSQAPPAVELWVDLALGLCDEQAAEKRIKALDVKDLKTALGAAIEGLRGDLFGVRHVAGEEFVAIVKKMETVSSFTSSHVIGVTRDRAYLEVKVHLTSKHSYVAIVTTELDVLPEEVLNQFKDAGQE